MDALQGSSAMPKVYTNAMIALWASILTLMERRSVSIVWRIPIQATSGPAPARNVQPGQGRMELWEVLSASTVGCTRIAAEGK